MTTPVPPICSGCTHFQREAQGFACDAFPGGIPSGILANEIDHREPVEGDQGIQFEPADDVARAYAVTIFGKDHLRVV